MGSIEHREDLAQDKSGRRDLAGLREPNDFKGLRQMTGGFGHYELGASLKLAPRTWLRRQGSKDPKGGGGVVIVIGMRAEKGGDTK